MTALDLARSEYRALRARAVAAGVSKERFDARARSLAHELADGEEMTASDWTRAAAEVLHDVTAR